MLVHQIDALKRELVEFYGDDPLTSKDISRVVNLYHFRRLSNLLDEENVSDKVVLGGQRNQEKL